MKIPPQADRLFEVDAGATNVDGKTAWPDLVRLVIPKDQALSFAMEVLRRLENARDGEANLLEIPLFGRLTVLEDD